ncbi:MAG: hypothetical protein E7006_01530 [Alphaproteobacteria bacterium]|nr:hypothetical protein [Alphaproteobacteria bacterium]
MKNNILTLAIIMLSACSYTIKPYKCYLVNESNKNVLEADYICITNGDYNIMTSSAYKVDTAFINYLTQEQEDICKFEEKNENSNEFFVWGKDKINLNEHRLYACSSGIAEKYINKKFKEEIEIAKQKEKEEKKHAVERTKQIKKWEKYTGCDYEKSIYIADDIYHTTQQLKEGLTVAVNYEYISYVREQKWPYGFFVIQNRIDEHFVDDEAWLGGWFQDTGVDRKFRNKQGDLKRIRKYKRCIDSETLEKFKRMNIQ